MLRVSTARMTQDRPLQVQVFWQTMGLVPRVYGAMSLLVLSGSRALLGTSKRTCDFYRGQEAVIGTR